MSPGLKPAFLAGFDAWAKAQAYLRSKNEDNSKGSKTKTIVKTSPSWFVRDGGSSEIVRAGYRELID
jgi:hypothetical protein